MYTETAVKKHKMICLFSPESPRPLQIIKVAGGVSMLTLSRFNSFQLAKQKKNICSEREMSFFTWFNRNKWQIVILKPIDVSLETKSSDTITTVRYYYY